MSASGSSTALAVRGVVVAAVVAAVVEVLIAFPVKTRRDDIPARPGKR